jgi:hypothetical protein
MVLACPPNNVLGRALELAYPDPTRHVPRFRRGRRDSCTAETYWARSSNYDVSVGPTRLLALSIHLTLAGIKLKEWSPCRKNSFLFLVSRELTRWPQHPGQYQSPVPG